MYYLFARSEPVFSIQPIDPNPKPPSTPLSDTTIWILIAAFIVIVICGIIATLILAKSIKRRKEKEMRQRIEDKQRETWRDY